MSAPFDRDDWIDEPLRQVLAERAAAPGEHPDAEELLEYHLRALPPEEEERLAEHLARCADCARLVLDYDALSAPVPEGAAPSQKELDEAWGRFEARRATRRPRLWWNAQTPAWALAASLLLSAGLFVWGRAAHDPGRGDERPSGRIVLGYLDPIGERTGRVGPTVRKIEVGSNIDKVSLTLGYEGGGKAPYRMELRPGDGKAQRILWADAEIWRDRSGSFAIVIPANRLPPGRYWIGIREGGKAAAEAPLLAQYPFQIVRPKPSS